MPSTLELQRRIKALEIRPKGSGLRGPIGPQGPQGNPGADGATLPVATYTSGTRPAAGVTWHRKFITVKDPGADEELQFCRQLGDGSYQWLVVGY